MNYLFDASWYAVKVGRSFVNLDQAWAHYNATSVIARPSPSPYFDKDYYLSVNGDVMSAGVDPFIHFIEYGETEGRNPHPLIDLKWYCDSYHVQSDAPLREYLATGWKIGQQTHPAFFASWYSKKNSVRSEPLLRYLLDFECKDDPSPLFSDIWYRQQAKLAKNIKPLVFYLAHGYLENPQFCEIFDTDFYTMQCLEQGYHNVHSDPLTAYLASPITINPHRLFDRIYVRQQIGSSDKRNELAIFLDDTSYKYDPHPLFSSKYYLSSRSDVRFAKVNPLSHYLRSGFEEDNAEPHPLLDMNEYKRQGQDLPKHIVALSHYIEFGYNENRSIFKSYAPIFSAERLGRVEPTPVPDQSVRGSHNAKKIGIFIHAFYPELISEFVPNINIIPGVVEVYISTDSEDKAYTVHKICSDSLSVPFEIRVEPNRGRDIAPMIVGFADHLQKVDLALHIHTKKSTHYQNGFPGWRRYLVQGNLGNQERIHRILSLFDDPTVGAVAPVDFAPIDALVQWGGNVDRCDRLMGMMSDSELSISPDNVLELPTGSMFWFRPKALQPLLDLRLSYMHFDAELGQVDGTLAHAIERLFFYVTELAGYRWLRFLPNGNTISVMEPGRLLPVQTRSTPITIRLPETTLFTGQKRVNSKPRLNLLIPTAERSIGYAGVSEALRLFFGAWTRIRDQFDCRVIATDVSFSNQIEPDFNGIIATMPDDGSEYKVTYVDGTARRRRCLALRPNDIFVAAAWWNALQARDLAQQQAAMFSGDQKRFVYLIQDYEPGFYEWSTRSALAESTYRKSEQIIPVFNTEILFNFFQSHEYFNEGIVYFPPMNEQIFSAIDHDTIRQNIMLLYLRPAATRNCFEFIDAVINKITQKSPELSWDWRFLAIGEDLSPSFSLRSSRIEAAGRLTLEQYAALLSTSKLGLSLMVSPHPSYPPLEMAAAGMKVLTNTYMNKDLSRLHHNITSFESFDTDVVSEILIDMMTNEAPPKDKKLSGPKVNWFFDGKGNVDEVIKKMEQKIRHEVRNSG